MAEFTHLHVHTEFSLLDGLAKIDPLMVRTRELGMDSLAITDHGTMYGVIQFYRGARKHGIKPVIGCELYVAQRGRTQRVPGEDAKPYHLTALVRNEVGYRNLMQLVTKAQLEGFYYKPRVDRELLEAHSDGLIILSGCPTAQIPRLIRQGKIREARELAGWFREVFGAENFYVEIQRHDDLEFLDQLNRELVTMSRDLDIPLVATNDVHFTRAEDSYAHEVLLCIQTGTTIKDPDRMRIGGTFYLRSPEEMVELFHELPEALTNTLRIAEQCELEIEFGHHHLPEFDVPEGYDTHSYLRHLCEEGIRQRYPEITEEIRQRLEYELQIIHQMGFDSYFLIVWDLCRFAQERGIWWNVRGSGAGSIVAYALRITNIDPLKHNLIFERFLNPGRISMPDIDLDFPDDQRDQLIRYTYEKYGSDRVAQIITFGTMGARAAIRDVGRALDLPQNEVDRVARLVPAIPGMPITIRGALEGDRQVPELRELYETQDYVRELLDTAESLEGVARHASTHAAGVVVSDKPLVEYVPLHRPTRGDASDALRVTQYPMEDVEAIGLLKIDFLGLATLTVMRRAVRLIEKYQGVKLDMHTIPLDDPAIYELLSSGEVTGVFQVEGAGMRRMLREMRPSRFEHVVAAISLYRPGPMEYIPTYIARMHGREPVKYRHPALKPILEETYAIIVFQEQIIRILTDLAGYSAGEADLVRRCVSEDMHVLEATSGRLLPIRDVEPGMHILTLDENYRITSAKIEAKFDNGIQEVFEVQTKNGRSIEVTAEHPFLTVLGWRHLSDLKIGDAIAVPMRLPVFGDLHPDPAVITLIAYLLGDGQCVNRDGYAIARFYNSNPRMLKTFIEAAEVLGAATKTYQHPRSRTVTVTTRGTNGGNPVVELVRQHGLACRAHEKQIPTQVFQYDEDSVRLFVSRLWDTDGSIEKTAISYSSSSRKLIVQLVHLLRRFGINPSYHERATSHRPNYSLTIKDQDDVRLFARNFGELILEPKRSRLRALIEQVEKKTRNTAKTQVPSEVLYLVKEAKRQAGLSWREAGLRMGRDPRSLSSGMNLKHPNRALSRHRLAELGTAFGSDHLRVLAESDVIWDPIVSIEPRGPKRVFDLSVPPYRNFVVQDVIVHNSVAKKKKEDLLKHRDKFVRGAVERGIPQEVALKIFDDIEFFARYGFNKSHASDYAVITCQTAYLKARYPVEYTTALLSVERDDTDKIALVAADCHRMGIKLLPPDVNHSELDFTIEDLPERALHEGNVRHRRGIRFGLGAIKNVGEGPVQAILEARQEGGPFRDLDDFCRRVDLRHVGRRALECLIKAGALDRFGRRDQLLAVMDRMIGVSQQAHQAAEVGQMSMFGGPMAPALVGSLFDPLPDVPETPRKTRLGWEKELMGLFLSEHPLHRMTERLERIATARCGEIDTSMVGQVVTVAGMVSSVRRITTRKGDAMAFARVEDLQGSVEVTIFPRVWEASSELWQEDNLVILRGRVEQRNDRVQIICNEVRSLTSEVLDSKSDAAPAVDHRTTDFGPAAGRRTMDRGPRTSHRPQDDEPSFHLMVTVQRTGDQETDIRLIGQVYDLLTGYQGSDRFSLIVVNGGSGVRLDFPNDTTHYCVSLLDNLRDLLGRDAVQVQPAA